MALDIVLVEYKRLDRAVIPYVYRSRDNVDIRAEKCDILNELFVPPAMRAVKGIVVVQIEQSAVRRSSHLLGERCK